ncbi:hypothetical protein WOLCODRAFT_14498 [Wolfiporia cocos MD-104 SS10]|uniref:Uncharacterized protein n=1 Tax=Wolfiporia cocos (strain MD-104) TaxID=742152 RepID=A0A2H3IZU7_WOLCO|nr:hypothetical protein WOLCODRAFT_14498 [Wolfiporia cocos MD-104 SS10]
MQTGGTSYRIMGTPMPLGWSHDAIDRCHASDYQESRIHIDSTTKLETGLTDFVCKVSRGSRVVTGLIALFTIAQFGEPVLGIYYTAREFVSSRVSQESSTDLGVVRQHTALAMAIETIVNGQDDTRLNQIYGKYWIDHDNYGRMHDYLVRSIAKFILGYHILFRDKQMLCELHVGDNTAESPISLNAREKFRNQRWNVESMQPQSSAFQPAVVNIPQRGYTDSEANAPALRATSDLTTLPRLPPRPSSHTHVAWQSKVKIHS